MSTTTMIDKATARGIASDWHGGQGSKFYAFASSGAMPDGLREEADRELRFAMSNRDGAYTGDDIDELTALVTFIHAAMPDWEAEGALVTYEQRYAYLTRDGEHLACFSSWGRTSDDCAHVAICLDDIMAWANGEAATPDGLEHLMGLVVNDHDDVRTLLAENATCAGWEYVPDADDGRGYTLVKPSW